MCAGRRVVLAKRNVDRDKAAASVTSVPFLTRVVQTSLPTSILTPALLYQRVTIVENRKSVVGRGEVSFETQEISQSPYRLRIRTRLSLVSLSVCAAVDGAVTRVSQPSTRARSRVSFAPATVIFVNWSTCTFSLTFLLNSFSY